MPRETISTLQHHRQDPNKWQQFMIKRPWSSLRLNNNNLHNQKRSKYTVPLLQAKISPFSAHICGDVLHYQTKNYQNPKQLWKHMTEGQIN